MNTRFLISAMLLIFLLGIRCDAFGQALELEIVYLDESPNKIKLDQVYEVSDSISVLNKLAEIRQAIIDKGYLTSSIDSIKWDSTQVKAFLYFGSAHTWAQLRPGNVPEEFLSKIGYREKIYRNEKFAPQQVSKLFKNLLELTENNGFPFADVKLDSVDIEQNGISADLNMDRKDFFTIDSLILKGNTQTNRRYIESHLGLKIGMAYDQSLINKIPTRLKELPFLRVLKPFEIGMRPGKADVYLYLDDKKASNFDGILGILPDSETDEIIITGDLKLSLLNSFKRGEKIKLQWQRLQTRTQELDLNFEYPFLFNTPLGINFEFNLYRQDTLFSQLNTLIGLKYFFLGSNSAQVYYENNQANVLSTSIFTLDEYVDSRTNMFGLGIGSDNLDYKFNPRRGYFIETRAAAGTKEIIQNPDIEDIEYEGVKLKSDIYNGTFLGGYYYPFGKRSTILTRVQSASILNENIFRNELFRIGGLKTLRGFNEQSIFASSYAIATLEYRFILEENSNLFVFFDQAWYEDRTRNASIRDTPFGFGAGISFETNAGVFSLTYALGKQFDNSIEIRDGKIHFGFTSFF